MSILRDILNGNLASRVWARLKEYVNKLLGRNPANSLPRSNANQSPRIRIIRRPNGSGSTAQGNLTRNPSRPNHTNHTNHTNHNPGQIVVNKVGKPQVCPYCRSPAMDRNNMIIIVQDPDNPNKWKCNRCGNSF